MNVRPTRLRSAVWNTLAPCTYCIGLRQLKTAQRVYELYFHVHMQCTKASGLAVRETPRIPGSWLPQGHTSRLNCTLQTLEETSVHWLTHSVVWIYDSSRGLSGAENSLCRLAQRTGIQDNAWLLTDWLFFISSPCLRTQECLQDQIWAMIIPFPALK